MVLRLDVLDFDPCVSANCRKYYPQLIDNYLSVGETGSSWCCDIMGTYVPLPRSSHYTRLEYIEHHVTIDFSELTFP